jgi:protein-S-isoprenylcysteine O-methyltransferase Ste14
MPFVWVVRLASRPGHAAPWRSAQTRSFALRARLSPLFSKARVSDNFLQRGGLWVLGQSALLCVVVVGGIVFHSQWHSLALTVCGACLLLVAASCGLAGKVSLGKNLTSFPKPSAQTRLVQTGVYGLIRHPLYTAVFCGSVGWALVWRSWPALLAALALAPFFDAKARREERWLRQQFPEYSDYERRVRRFVPWVY